MIKKYQKTAIVEAIKVRYDNEEEIKKFAGDKVYKKDSELWIKTLEGDVRYYIDYYICKGIKNEFWPVDGDIFEQTYEEVKEDD